VRWRREGVDLTVSVNAFARQLQQPNFPGALAGAMERCPEAGWDRLQIEIVETAALKDLDVARQMIEDCRKLGVSFSLDDFGTGYSTLAHVRHLPVAEIKIDQSFVRQMLARSEDLAIVEVVIRLGRAFGRSLVAEGVETPAHIVRLLALGCDVMQGFALARPMPPDDIPRWVREFRPDPAWGRTAAVGMEERAAGALGAEREAAAAEIRVPTP
jgi:EAL domain-containing protein (putative c-di-GMP-specific phosphodiesterase class I)